MPKTTKHLSVVTDSLFSMRLFNADRDLPIVYHANYNMYFGGLELLHHFDSKKYSKIAEHLSDEFLDTPFARVRHYDEEDEDSVKDPASVVRPRRLRYLAPNRPMTDKELELHHTPEYIHRLHNDKSMIARVTEIWALNLVPMLAIESRLMNSIRLQAAGTIFAFHLAMQHGWAINLGGGFHQAAADRGETFCLLSDIFLAIKYIWRKHPLQKYLIIDLDAHQATGLERDIVDLEPKRRRMIHMLDMFNNSIQPPDAEADKGINQRVELGRFTGDETYLKKLDDALALTVANFTPTVIIYIAGQDVLKDDKLGLMNLTDEALMKRDERVFTMACEKLKRPIVMLLGGGYSAHGAKLQADSIRNLFAKGLIWGGHRSGSRSLSRPKNRGQISRTGSSSGSSGSDRPKSFKTMNVPPTGPTIKSAKTSKIVINKIPSTTAKKTAAVAVTTLAKKISKKMPQVPKPTRPLPLAPAATALKMNSATTALKGEPPNSPSSTDEKTAKKI